MSSCIFRILTKIAQAAEVFGFYRFVIGFWQIIFRFAPHSFNVQLNYNRALLQGAYYLEAESGFQKMIEDWPLKTEPLSSLAYIYKVNCESKKAKVMFEKALKLQPKNLKLRSAYILNLIKVLDYDQAESLYHETAKQTNNPMFLSIKADIHNSRGEWSSMKACLENLCARYPDHIALKAKKGQMYYMAANKSNSIEFMREAEEIYRKLVQCHPEKLRFKVILAKILITVHKDEEAIRVINSIPWLSQSNKHVMKLNAWRCHNNQNVDGAKKIWKRLTKYHYSSRVKDSSSDLELKSKNVPNVKANGIILFTFIKNEIWRLPWLMDYYRALGVDHFIIIDNDSSDGAEDFLLLQKDVTLFHTKVNFGKAHDGIPWINTLIEKYAQNHWCLYVDADEALVFPCDNEKNLRSLTKYMDQKGQEALPAFMLDMHGENQDGSGISDYSDFKNNYPYFMNDYTFWGGVECPYIMVSGGIRSVYNICSFMHKTPLIRGGRGIKFLSSSHNITPAHLSDVSAVLLHYKIVGDFLLNAQKKGDDNRGPSCRARYQTYSRVSKKLGSHYSFINEKTLRYESSNQLVEIGLIKKPDDFVGFDCSS